METLLTRSNGLACWHINTPSVQVFRKPHISCLQDVAILHQHWNTNTRIPLINAGGVATGQVPYYIFGVVVALSSRLTGQLSPHLSQLVDTSPPFTPQAQLLHNTNASIYNYKQSLTYICYTLPRHWLRDTGSHSPRHAIMNACTE